MYKPIRALLVSIQLKSNLKLFMGGSFISHTHMNRIIVGCHT